MITYIIRRVLYSIPVLFFSMFLSFTFVSLAGDPIANLRQNPRVQQNTINHMIHQLHLDQPIPIRFFDWLWSLLQHGFGRSLLTSQPLWPQITRTMSHTAQLVIIAEVIAIVIGCAVGMYSAIRQYSPFDYTFTTLSFIGFAMPTFWLALLLQELFVIVWNDWHIRIFYTFGINSPGDSSSWSLDRFQHIGLPVITLATISFALYSRYMRASMLDVINSDYVRTARAKGVPERKVILRHVVPNALIPVVTVTALNLGGLLGGAIITETIFTLDGFGQWFLENLSGSSDCYAVMAYLVITAVIIIAFNLIADILYGVLDPRIRYD